MKEIKRITKALIEKTNDKETLEIILKKLVVVGWDDKQKYNNGCSMSPSLSVVLLKMDKVLTKLNILTEDTWEYKDFHNSGLNYFDIF